MKILKLKVMSAVKLKREEIKENFHVEKNSPNEKVLGFLGGASCDLPRHPKFNKFMFGF